VPINPIYDPGYEALTHTPIGGITTGGGPGVMASVATGGGIVWVGEMGIMVAVGVTGEVVTGTTEGPDMIFAMITSPATIGRMAMIRITIAR
jgi:hypothetical protein